MLVEVVVDFFAGIQFFVGGIGEDEYFYSLTFGEDSTIECLAVPRFVMYDIMCNISSGFSTSLVSSFSA